MSAGCVSMPARRRCCGWTQDTLSTDSQSMMYNGQCDNVINSARDLGVVIGSHD